MKKIKLLSVILLALVGCQKVEDSNNESKLMSFIAEIEVPTEDLATRTILGGLTTDANRSVLWEFNDQICVANGTSYAKFTNQTEGASDLAVFEGSLAQGANYYAAYPYDMVTGYSSAGFEIELPANQEYYKDGISSGSFPMVAHCQEGVFNFRNLCSILVLQLTGDKTVSSITFSGKDSDGDKMPVAGVGTVSMSYSDYPSMSLDSSLSYQVTLSCGNGVSLNNTTPTSFHLVLPVGTYNGFELQIETTDGSKMVVNSDKTLNIKRSTRTTTAPLTYIDIIDLSSSGTANCYIVSKAGKYKFNASVKGNSTESIGTVAEAEVLWESFGTDVTPSVGDIIKNATYKDGYIEFETPSALAEGNAVIAAKNSSGTILWSWHIWVTDQPEEQVYYNDAGTMMDRNLGATSATPGDVEAFGLLYQWGRKDPFIGRAKLRSATEAVSTITWPSAVLTSSSEGSIDFAIQNPMTYISGSEDVDNDWHFATRKDDLWLSEKTIYDPCPHGWRVPCGYDNGIWVNACGSVYAFEWPYNSSYEGMDFCNKFGDSTTIWYPASISSKSIYGGYSYLGVYWSVTTLYEYAQALQFQNIEYNVDVSHNNAKGRAGRYSVRCQKE